jgi:hypothetical protein
MQFHANQFAELVIKKRDIPACCPVVMASLLANRLPSAMV